MNKLYHGFLAACLAANVAYAKEDVPLPASQELPLRMNDLIVQCAVKMATLKVGLEVGADQNTAAARELLKAEGSYWSRLNKAETNLKGKIWPKYNLAADSKSYSQFLANNIITSDPRNVMGDAMTCLRWVERNEL